MGNFKALSLAGALTAAAFSPAFAADLLPPPPPVEPPMMPVAEMSGWYLRTDVGIGINEMSNMRSTLQPTNALGGAAPGTAMVYSDLGDSGLIGIGVGYQFNNWFRGDLTAEYRSSADYRKGMIYTAFCASAFCLDTYSAHVRSGVFMANGYVDLGTWYGLTPYVGAGVGLAHHSMRGLTDIGLGRGYAPDNSKDNFAWAVMAGLAYNVTPNLKIDVGYRYIDMGKYYSTPIVCESVASCFGEVQSYRHASHDVRFGVRYMLGDAAPVPVLAPSAPIFNSRPGPLVRKY
ncbi:MAG: outer membrane protein [Rhodoblastus sp.]